MNEKEKNYWKVVIQMAQGGNQDMQENLDSENRWRKENNLPSIEEELNLVEKKEMVQVILQHPETTLWAVVPKAEWEKTPRTTEAILELVEKQVSGKSFQEAIAAAKEDVRLRAQGVPESLERQLAQLLEALENAEVIVEPATAEDKPMTLEELDWAENSLLNPEPRPVWDSPSA